MAVVFDPQKMTSKELRRLGSVMARSSSRNEIQNNIEMLQSALVCVAMTLADVMDRMEFPENHDTKAGTE
jgi:hypothetical protein